MISDIAAIDPLALSLRPGAYVRLTLSHPAWDKLGCLQKATTATTAEREGSEDPRSEP
jgi:hypothetical protein